MFKNLFNVGRLVFTMNKRRILGFILIILLLAIISIYYPNFTGQTTTNTKVEYPLENAVLLRVIDGDTIEIDEGVHVRLLGINTPEKKMPFSNLATEFLKQFENKSIQLLRDWEDTDKYIRKLRYLFYDNRMINLEIIESGFANIYYEKGLSYEQELLRAESQARAQELGIWKKSGEQ